jgi:hypothetical protein
MVPHESLKQQTLPKQGLFRPQSLQKYEPGKSVTSMR